MSFPSDMTAPPTGELPPLPEPAAAYGRGCNLQLEDGESLYTADQMREYALLSALRLREWRPIAEAPWDEVVLLCDANGNRWTDCAPRHPANGCGMPAIAFMPLPAPPTADDLARVLEESATGDEAGSG